MMKGVKVEVEMVMKVVKSEKMKGEEMMKMKMVKVVIEMVNGGIDDEGGDRDGEWEEMMKMMKVVIQMVNGVIEMVKVVIEMVNGRRR
ncbi:hypothetical protein Pcinc_037182 [Petrolisthes cinctipes]|uniref:Uncharacterized protein n=1 Tax=Petrolisthes cinctipes TaxID=88211 RepID=A0AAE1EMW3_PETCI|nr:hypothetical protein Pcinc_037182 [Petrolisthes cinctipes]